MNSIGKLCLALCLLMCALAASPANAQNDAESEKPILDKARTLLNWRTDLISFFVCQYDQNNVGSLSSLLSDDAMTEIKRLLDLASGEGSRDSRSRTLPPYTDGLDEVKDALKNCSAASTKPLPTSLKERIKDQYDNLIKELPASRKASMKGVELSFKEVGDLISPEDLKKKTIWLSPTKIRALVLTCTQHSSFGLNYLLRPKRDPRERTLAEKRDIVDRPSSCIAEGISKTLNEAMS